MEDMVCVRRKEYDVGCNWKLFFENFAEQYHIPFVHSGSLYKKKRQILPPDETHGNYVAKFVAHKGSRALLEGETGFPPIPTLEGRHTEGTYYPSIFPNTMFGCCIDVMWYVELQPQGPRRTKVIVGSCVPKANLQRPDFEATMQKYYARWDTTIPEDIVALELQQQGLESPLATPGRFCKLERLVHDIDNWILDRVIGNVR
jgi:phenylpropionate dioxygenase-like ring-hydroxylating dioxygenase large terminal subunit